jgi:hypothetical protein
MNYHQNKKLLSDLLLTWKRNSDGKDKKKLVNTFNNGCYIISQKEKDFFMKLGTAYGKGGLMQRLRNYQICYPSDDEFWIRYLFITDSAKARKLENALGTGINSKAKAQYSEEWQFNYSTHKLELDIKKVLLDNVGLWKTAFKMTRKGWKFFTPESNVVFGSQLIRDTGSINRELINYPGRKYKPNATKPKIPEEVYKKKITKNEGIASEALLNLSGFRI